MSKSVHSDHRSEYLVSCFVFLPSQNFTKFLSKMAEQAKNNLLLLFQKPNEPLFAGKDDGKTIIEVPDEYFTDRYRTLGDELFTRFGENATNKVVLKSLKSYPDVSFASVLSKDGAFSLFNQIHKEIAGKLIQIFIDQPDPETFFTVAAYVKDRVNHYLYQYCLSVAVQHRKDTKDVVIPSIVTMFPDNFVDPSAFPKAREEAALLREESRQHINIPMEFTSTDKEVEQKLAYFREGKKNVFQMIRLKVKISINKIDNFWPRSVEKRRLM